ncbi:CDP-glucose 4,6-dehydratase [Desulfobotulus sp. H1]|uniref:CDP-glucose 4,6-dehydratase n=1 Tax=Desulfobotulus pelophilus TaxID=2823377 RepID=A0ABT3NEM0_9BACT|nr:CDP-glucose 4,6-dehydratase [Desulfobotulus pelophilus]MCW7755342.1 CDP-glucose 4,6-dehydratase [Desulfobotulus pelophilus]
MEKMVKKSHITKSFWSGRRVFLTGHTGFKGGWLAIWLASMGAKVYGYALRPPIEPAFFNIAGVSSFLVANNLEDIRDSKSLHRAMAEAAPEVVFHMAAQPLVRQSYTAPFETCEVNIMGTVHLMEAARNINSVKVLVNITTDKCYENQEWFWPYRENEPLGGRDPYSASKACSEILTSAWRSSFLKDAGVWTATARAGNVIGGGDWAEDRLIPDILRAVETGKTLMIRSPAAVRPWQHVLEPLSGYLMLAEKLYSQKSSFEGAWNFGPSCDDAVTVQSIVEQICRRFPLLRWGHDPQKNVPESTSLRLDSSLARAKLGWHPRWKLPEALDQTLIWYEGWKEGRDMFRVSMDQISAYEKAVFL